MVGMAGERWIGRMGERGVSEVGERTERGAGETERVEDGRMAAGVMMREEWTRTERVVLTIHPMMIDSMTSEKMIHPMTSEEMIDSMTSEEMIHPMTSEMMIHPMTTEMIHPMTSEEIHPMTTERTDQKWAMADRVRPLIAGPVTMEGITTTE